MNDAMLPPLLSQLTGSPERYIQVPGEVWRKGCYLTADLQFYMIWSPKFYAVAITSIVITLAFAPGCASVNSSDPNARRKAVQQITDPTQIGRLAKESPYPDVRKAAVARLTDQTIIANVAIFDSVSNVRRVALDRLSDQAALTRVVLVSDDSAIEESALDRLTQSSLAKVLATSKAVSIQKAAFEKLSDQVLLLKIVREDERLDIRVAALSKLKDQTTLENIVTGDTNSALREFAATMLTNEVVLEKIASEDADYRVQLAALSKITNQDRLLRIALSANLESSQDYPAGNTIRGVAFRKITDQAALEKYALETERMPLTKESASDWSHSQLRRRSIVERSTNQVVLSMMATNDADAAVRKIAISKLTNEALLSKIALDETKSGVRQVTIGSEWEVRVTALQNRYLRDQTVLLAIAEKETNRAVRLAAIAKTRDHRLLEKLAETKEGFARPLGGDTAICATAWMRLVLLDPIVGNRLPDVELKTGYWETEQAYEIVPGVRAEPVRGEGVSLEITQGTRTLASGDWDTDFPKQVPNSTTFIPTLVDLSDMICQLFSWPRFTDEDLRKLAETQIPEIRSALTKNNERQLGNSRPLSTADGPYSVCDRS